MTETVTGRIAPRPATSAFPPLPTGPLAWQRTSVVGTELVFSRAGSATGTAVVTGPAPYSLEWHAGLDDTSVVRELSVTCRGGSWSRTLQMRRTGDGWVTQADETGDAGLPPAGGDTARLDPEAVPRLADSPIFMSWAVRRLGLSVESGAVSVPSVRVAVPSLTLLPGVATYHLVSPNRLRLTGDGPAVTFELDQAGVVAYQAGHLRQIR